MSAIMPARLLVRQSRLLARQNFRRQASSTAEAASSATAKTKDVASSAASSASNATSKASQGLSRVTSSAGSALSNAGTGLTNMVGRIGGRTGRLIAFVESLIPPTIYYSRVGIEVSKLVFRGQRMSPPDAAAFSAYFSPLIHALRNPSTLFRRASDLLNTSNPESVISRARNLNRGDVVAVSVLGAEVLGFFTVGEIIGKFKVIGYRGDPHAGAAHHE